MSQLRGGHEQTEPFTEGLEKGARVTPEQERERGSRDVVKFTVNLPRQSAEMLREIAANRGTTVTETVRQLISTEKVLQDALDEGGKILIEYPGKESIRQLLIVR
jgi:hypothetical protein